MPRNEKNKNLGISPTVPLFSTPFNVIIHCLCLSNWRKKLWKFCPNNQWPNYLKGNNIQSQPWSLSWLSTSRLSKHLKPGCLFVLCVCLFVCVFVSWLLVQCQPGEQTSINRCTVQVPSKRTKTSIASCASFLLFIFLSSGSKRTRRTRMWLKLLSWVSAADRCNGLEHKPWKGARSTRSKDLLISPSSSTPFQLFAKCTVPIFRPHLDPPAPTWMETLGHLHLGQF